jgi:endonuclease YncB( thermonuclease family)
MSKARALLCTFVTVLVFCNVPCFSWGFGPRYVLYGKARLSEVEAPNVLKMRMLDDNRTVSLRLLGVGSPHNRDRTKGLGSSVLSYIRENDLWEVARSYVRSVAGSKEVEVWTRKWDRYDDKRRLLAYIRIPMNKEPSVDLNGEIIRNGMGFVTRDYVHVTFAGYRDLEEDAKKNHRGIWQALTSNRVSLSRPH